VKERESGGALKRGKEREMKSRGQGEIEVAEVKVK
jgi:hypothetical protein